MRKRVAAVLFFILLSCGVVSAQQVNEPKLQASDPWAMFQFLIGDWVGEGTGKPGEGTGGFSLRPELGGHVLVRRSVAEYPATANRPATRHEDVMYIYPGEKALGGSYFDNEGHVIRYEISHDTDGVLIFTSIPDNQLGPAPRFRLTYRKTGADSVDIYFEIAPPGPKESFSMYLRAKATRKKS